MKLNKPMQSLLNAQLKIQDRISKIQKKMDSLQDNAGNLGRTLTEKEQFKYDDLHKELVNLYCENNDLQIAIDAIIDYCDLKGD